MLKTFAVGNLVKEPETRTTKSGDLICQFIVAANLRQKDANGGKKTEFVQVTAFGKLAEITSQHLHKGRKVTCIGEISGGAYMGADNQPHYSLRLTADEVEFMGGKMQEMEESRAQDAAKVQNFYNQQNAVPEGFVQIASEEELPF